MRFRIKYDCELAIILADGTMSSIGCEAGMSIVPQAPICLPSPECGVMHIDIVVTEMTLINVPIALLEEETACDVS